jgi:chromosome segregation ATPase
MEKILSISSSEVVGIGPVVVEQERELSRQLGGFERLEQGCMADNAEVQSALAGLSKLMELVGDHLERSRLVRDRLQLLTFNSIIEASHLGAKADAILEISENIKRISSSWSEMTNRSAQAMDEILGLVEKSKSEMNAFSQGGNDELRAAQSETMNGLEQLRAAAHFASDQAAAIEDSTQKLQAKIEQIGATADRMDACFNNLGAVLGQVEAAGLQWETDHPGAAARCDHQEVEEMFSAFYTTEIERDVLRAALCGTAVPVAEHNLAGNDVELF